MLCLVQIILVELKLKGGHLNFVINLNASSVIFSVLVQLKTERWTFKFSN